MGYSGLPLADRLIRDKQAVSKFFLRISFLPPQSCHKGTEFLFVYLKHSAHLHADYIPILSYNLLCGNRTAVEYKLFNLILPRLTGSLRKAFCCPIPSSEIPLTK